MKRPILTLLGAAAFCTAIAMAQAPKDATSKGQTASLPPDALKFDPRSKALEVAGAFTNEGFKIRDGHYDAQIEPGKPQVIDVNLYAGNQYWFCVGAMAPGKKLSVTVYDENGKKVQSEPYQDENVAAAGIVAETSGRYYVEVTLEEGQKTEYSFLYAYK